MLVQDFFVENGSEEQGMALQDDFVSPLYLNEDDPFAGLIPSEIETPVANQPFDYSTASSDLLRMGSFGEQMPIALSLPPLVYSNSLQLPSIPSRTSFDDSLAFMVTPFEESLPPSNRASIPSEVVLVDCPLSEETATESIVLDIPQSVPLNKEPEQESSDDDWLNGIESPNISACKNKPLAWTKEECNRLREGVAQYGSSGYWKEVSKFVGTRSVSQCINKWKNDLCKTKTRWNRAATTKLLSYLKKGLTDKEIAKLMPEYTYIQLYQQIQKHNTNQQPWEDWEIEKLIELKKEGVLYDTQIGRKLNNRHRDAVKNMWNRIKNSE